VPYRKPPDKKDEKENEGESEGSDGWGFAAKKDNEA
jgi:hypothetical protein